LYLARLGSDFERAGEDRLVAQPAGPFALAPAPSGGVLAVVEADRRSGGQVVLLARVTSNGEARNVPREMVRTEGVDGVAVAWTGTGYAVAWGARGGPSPGSYVIFTDARGVPRGPARRLLDATGPRLVSLPNADAVVLSATGGSGDPTFVALALDGTTTASTRVPASVRTLSASPSGASASSLVARPDPEGGTSFGLFRWSIDAPPSEIDVALHMSAGASVLALVPDRAGLLATIEEPQLGRELVVRVALDGSATLLAARPGSLGAAVANADGAITVVGHEPPPLGAGRLALVQLACPRASPASSNVPTVTEGNAPDAAVARTQPLPHAP
jgi:hypothetical protein